MRPSLHTDRRYLCVRAPSLVTSLNISGNPLSDTAMYATEKDAMGRETRSSVAKADTKGLFDLAEAVKLSSSLTSITLEGGQGSTLPIAALKGDQKLRMIDLSRKGLSFVSAIFIGVLMRGNTLISELVLSSNDLSPVGTARIVRQLSNSINILDISNVVRAEDTLTAEKMQDKKLGRAAVAIPPRHLAELWAAVSALGTLKQLDRLSMDRNHLTSLASFAKLVSLKTLSLANNRLFSLPEDIHLIRGLRSLILNSNQLQELPKTLGELEALERVDVRSNKLVNLPVTFSHLKNLKTLDATDNRLQTLHPSICDMHALERIELKDNPLQRPPLPVARNGIGGIRKFFQEQIVVGSMASYGTRLVLLGKTDTGKTSLVSGLRTGTAEPARHSDATALADIHSITMGEGSKQIWLSIWDLAGRSEYAAMIQPFLVEGAIFILAVPALDVSVLSEQYTAYVGQWLQYLQVNVPTAIVLPVLTKCDMLHAVDSLRRTPSTYQSLASAQVTWLAEVLEAHKKTQPDGAFNVLFPVQCTSAVVSGEATLEGLKARIAAVVFAEGGSILPSVHQPIPRPLYLSMVFLRALRDGRELIDSARTADLGYIPSTMDVSRGLTIGARPFATYADIQAIYMRDFAPALKLPMSTEALDAALALLYKEGEMVPTSCGVVLLNPTYMIRVLKPLFDHRMGTRHVETMEGTLWSAVVMGKAMLESERLAIFAAAKCLGTRAELREELLLALWQAIGVKQDAISSLTNLCRQIGILALSEHTQQGRSWRVPMRVAPSDPSQADVKEARKAWRKVVTDHAAEVLCVTLPVGPILPAGLLERLLAMCAPCVTHGTLKCWSRVANFHWRGALPIQLELQSKGGDSPRPHADLDAEQSVLYELSIQCCTEYGMRLKAWAAMMQIRDSFATIVKECRGLRPQGVAMLCCPTCTAKRVTAVGADLEAACELTNWPLEEALTGPKRCDVCNEKVNLPTEQLAAAEPPPPMSLIMPDELLGQRARSSANDKAFSIEEVRLGRPLESLLSHAKILGLGGPDDIERLRVLGEAGIIEEFEAEAQRPTAWTEAEMGEYGWSELDWCLYLSTSRADTATEGGTASSAGGDPAKLHADRRTVLRQQARTNGRIDAGCTDSTLDYFLKLPEVVAAGLTKGQLLALRLIASPVAAKINRALHNGCDPARPHPYPTTIILLFEALSKLWHSQRDQRRAASKAALTCAEEARLARQGDNDEAMVVADAAAKHAAAEIERVRLHTLWMGVCGLSAMAVKQRGGSTVGFLRLSSSREVAQEQAVEQLRQRLIQQAEVRQAEMRQAEMQQAEMQQAEVQQAEVRQAEIQQAEVRQAEMQQAEVQQAEVQQAEVQQTFQTNSDSCASFDGSVGGSGAVEEGRTPEKSELEGTQGGNERRETEDHAHDQSTAPSTTLAGSLPDAASNDAPEGSCAEDGTLSDTQHDSQQPLPRVSAWKRVRQAKAKADVAAIFAPHEQKGFFASMLSGGNASELPVLLLRIEKSQSSAAVDLSFLSPIASSDFCIPPGAFFEQRKETVEAVSLGEDDVDVKILDVMLHLPLFVAARGQRKRDNCGDL